ncbi:MAG: PEP-CTERM sorting domain-containing protein [Bryobacteraceae bacterium]
MKNLLVLVTVYIAVPFSGSAAQICMTDNLANYIALAAGGCMVGTSTVNNFSTLGLPTGSTAIAPSAVTITPLNMPNSPGLQFGLNVNASGSPQEILFGYNLSSGSITGATLTMANATAAGNGTASGLEHLCLGGNFTAGTLTGCSTGPPTGLATVVVSGFSQGTNQATFAAVSNVRVQDDFVADPGGTGSASIGTFTNNFTATGGTTVPEPSTMLLLSAGLCGVGLLRRRVAGRLGSKG